MCHLGVVLLFFLRRNCSNITLWTCTHAHTQSPHPGRSAEMILIGYDGIAFPPILFPHQPSLFMFLECLENSLLPQGCLEPPLWYIKTHATKVGRAPCVRAALVSCTKGFQKGLVGAAFPISLSDHW